MAEHEHTVVREVELDEHREVADAGRDARDLVVRERQPPQMHETEERL